MIILAVCKQDIMLRWMSMGNFNSEHSMQILLIDPYLNGPSMCVSARNGTDFLATFFFQMKSKLIVNQEHNSLPLLKYITCA